MYQSFFWRTQLQPIRTIGEITAHIKILPIHQPYVYQKLSQKATQLRLLGMTYGKIVRSLHINRKTAIKACKYQVYALSAWTEYLPQAHIRAASPRLPRQLPALSRNVLHILPKPKLT
ncbi:hypothetical protein CEE34_06485 [Candidatus Aerophobetes bacterium Ae_b3a]|nr:MAG: hypothetical protein CEE34_06485 [Candidatus Aerophobetes bacterium Ae_b3a]